MVVLVTLVALGLAMGCYSPEVEDCRVTCSSNAECVDGQTCSAGYCASGEGTTCTEGMPPVTARPDAMPVTIDAPPQEPTTILHLRGNGGGTVQVPGQPACTDCMVTVPRGKPIVITALPNGGKVFEKWETIACATQDTTCMLTPALPAIDVTAKFKND